MPSSELIKELEAMSVSWMYLSNNGRSSEVSGPARAHAKSTDGVAKPSADYPSLNKNQRPHFDDGSRLIARKRSCKSVWCKVCYKRFHASRHASRMLAMLWQQTRFITLTLDRDLCGSGKSAYIWYKQAKPIGRFIQNLGRAGVTVEDWTCNLEWHKDGSPHFHLLIQVSLSGKAGQIGQELIHRCWPYGRIHETYFKTETNFKSFIGYFAKSGYLHKDKKYQIQLPAWTEDEDWKGKKINRFSSMKKNDVEPKPEKLNEILTDDDIANSGLEEKQEAVASYFCRHEKCGTETELWLISPGIKKEVLKGYLAVPYKELVGGLFAGEFREKVGFVCDGLAWQLLDRLHDAFAGNWHPAANY